MPNVKMSKNRNRAKFNKAKTQKEYKYLTINHEYPIYWDDGITLKKGLFSYQYRMYRTWKYNRKTKWIN